MAIVEKYRTVYENLRGSHRLILVRDSRLIVCKDRKKEGSGVDGEKDGQGRKNKKSRRKKVVNACFIFPTGAEGDKKTEEFQ